MPKKPKDKVVTKLVNYVKRDRPKKFKACVKKYDVDLQLTRLPKGRTLMHCAAKHGCGLFINYLLTNGVLASETDNKGDLALHLALDRALQLTPDEAADVYNNIVVPLLKAFPGALYYCDHRGANVSHLLAMLNRHILSANESDSDSSSDSDSDSEWSDSASSYTSVEDFNDRLAREFESESADFFGRYNYGEDYMQESQGETYREWAERMGSEMHGRQKYRHHTSQSAGGGNRKRKHSSEHTKQHQKPPRSKAGINAKEEITKARSAQSMAKLRTGYEERFQAVLKERGERKMSYSEVPWPSKGSIQHVMEVLFGDKAHWTATALKKYVREQQVRWHPDKFLQKFIDKIAPKSFEKVMERVKEISQALNKKAELLSAG